MEKLKKKVIILDVDDVVLDLVSNWLRLYNRDFNDDVILEDITEWNIAKFVKPKAKFYIYDYVHRGAVFETASPIKDSIDSIHEILSWSDICRIVYVTAGDPLNSKEKWLKRYNILPNRKDFVSCIDKSLIRGFSILDDKYSNVTNFIGKGYLFDKPWNREFIHHNRIIGWKDYMNRLKVDLGVT